MDQDRFDSLAKSVTLRSNRRRMLKGLLGLGAGAAVASVALSPAEAARRGFSRPTLPIVTPPPMCGAEGSGCARPGDCCSSCCVSAGGADPVCAAAEICVT